jgi:hypothetical protein
MSPKSHLQRLGGLALLVATLGAAAVGCGCGEDTRTVLVSQPVPAPTGEPDPPSRHLPAISGAGQRGAVVEKDDVVGGGPASGDEQAVVRLNAQFPDGAGTYVLTDAEALDYLNKAAAAFPELNLVVGRLKKVATCATEYGVVGARAYVAPDFSHAGAMVAISRLQLERLPQIAAKCFIDNVIGGGPSTTGRFNPCFTSYSIDAQVNGVVDRYYIFAGGTNQAWCDYFAAYHRYLNPQPLSF